MEERLLKERFLWNQSGGIETTYPLPYRLGFGQFIIYKTVPKHVRACPSNDFGSFQIDPKIAIFDPGITILDPRMTSLGITRDFRTRSSVRESAEISTAPGAL